ncbi:unnamed protein product [Caenorhabditis bovis]|uniref:Selenocysteine lyase n=1 Tax=Caenorhabditis bovis TaxID=2654633 RepID=A0A8S1FG23_9PELO|nr:unnamed protein product [Caenorhabditis bovis]
MTDKIYLDHNATTPLDSSVKEDIIKALDFWQNPSSLNESANNVFNMIQNARCQIAQMCSAKPEGVIFTSGGTESNNWIIEAHDSILEAIAAKERKGLASVTLIPVDPTTGHVTVESVLEAITNETALVTIMMANNETGVLQPIVEIYSAIQQKFGKNRPILHCDAAQVAGKMNIDTSKLFVDVISIVGHKFYGPRIGALILSDSDLPLPPLLYGGKQESGRRSGTENTPMIVGLGSAAKCVNEKMSMQEDLENLRNYFEASLEETFGDNIIINFKSSPRLPNTSSVSFVGYSYRSRDLLQKCHTFYASTGSTCHRGEDSPVLRKCGIPYDVASKTVRFSVGKSTTKDEIDIVVKELAKLLNPDEF